MERLKQDLLAKVRMLGRELPVNTLDELIDQLGGPERVAEVSSLGPPPGSGSEAPWWPPQVPTQHGEAGFRPGSPKVQPPLPSPPGPAGCWGLSSFDH